MLTIGISRFAYQIVKQELAYKGRLNEALYIHFDLGMGHYTERKSYTQRRGLHLLYYLRPEMSYITVFSSITASPFASIKEVPGWKHECTHDSCWRDINVFSQTATGHYQFATDWLPFDEAVVSLAEETNNHAKYLIDLVKLARSEQ